MTVEAPDFSLPNMEGELIRLSDFRGKKVLLLTWASW
jgi:peroxiredoxin